MLWLPLSGLQICWVSFQLWDQGMGFCLASGEVKKPVDKENKVHYLVESSPNAECWVCRQVSWTLDEAQTPSQESAKSQNTRTTDLSGRGSRPGQAGDSGKMAQMELCGWWRFRQCGSVSSFYFSSQISRIRISWVFFHNIPNNSKHLFIFVCVHVYCVYTCVASSLFEKYINRIILDTVKGHWAFFSLGIMSCGSLHAIAYWLKSLKKWFQNIPHQNVFSPFPYW